MQLTLGGKTALAILRNLRASRRALPRHADLHDPEPAPHGRWGAAALRQARAGIPAGPVPDRAPLEVLVGSREARLRAKGAKCRVCMGELPAGAFLDLGGGLYSSGPELAFLEGAARLALPHAVLLGLELCGAFSRNALDPRSGRATMELAPVTSVERLRAFLDGARGVRGLNRARQALRYVADNAWSPMEAVVACMMAIPPEENGYGFGRCVLNLRVDTREAAIGPGDKSERVPDILVAGTSVGINYDGEGHLDLDSVVSAAMELGSHLGSSRSEAIVRRSVAGVRAKAVDDIRRNRALTAAGYTVYPVVKEDLYENGALDGVMWQVLIALEERTKRRYPELRLALRSSFAQDERFELLASMLPGRVRLPEDDGVEEAFVRLPRAPRGATAGGGAKA